MGARLKDKVTLITGTGGGQGRAAALLFASEGAIVVGCDLNVKGDEETVELVRRAGGHMDSNHPVDLGDSEQARRWVDAAAEQHGRIDVLYNNASLPKFAPVGDMTDDEWHYTIRNELDLVFYTCSAAWPHLAAAGGGAIINVGSISGVSAVPETPGGLAHAATKGAVIALTRVLADEGAPLNIRANSVSPGIIETPATSDYLQQSRFRDEHLDAVMLKRIGRGEDVAAAALFLASDESGWVTGTNIMVDGGYTAH